MRLQLAGLAAALLVVGLPVGDAAADGTVAIRGAYYKERSTRVQQPMIDAALEAGDRGTVDVHALVDSITSASAAAGATGGGAFTERRYELGLGYRHSFERIRAGGGARLSTESDYTSAFAHGRIELDLAERNTVLAGGLARGHDAISNAGAQGLTPLTVSGTLDTTMLSIGVSQVLGETMLASLGYDLLVLSGFQENPYRLVPAAGQLELERVPDRRLRHAAVAGVRGYLPPARTTLIGGYRYYADDWGVRAHTLEGRAVVEVAEGVELGGGYRYYRQRAADFYREVYDTADPMVEPYLTADVKLSRMHSHTVGGKVAVRLAALGATGTLGLTRVDVVVDHLRPSTYLGPATIAQLGVTVPFAY